MRNINRLLCCVIMLFEFTYAHAQERSYPTKTIEPIYGLSFTDAERDSMMNNLQAYQKDFEAIHQYKMSNAVPMSLVFDPLPTAFQMETTQRPVDWGLPKEVKLPVNREELAFFPVYKLAVLIKPVRSPQ